MAVQAGNYGRLMEPGLRKIFFETYKEKPEQYSKVFNVLTSKKAIETDARMGGFPLWSRKGHLASTEYKDPTEMDKLQYKHITFSEGYQVEKEMIDDEQYNIIVKMTKALSRAARATIETEAAEVLNNAFTVWNTDYRLDDRMEPLIANNHKRLDGGTASNFVGALNLTEQNLELAFKLAREQVDERGIKIQMNPKVLIVPPSLEFTAEKIAKSVQLPGTELNDINPLRGRFQVIVLDYLTDDGRWFLIDPDLHQLNFFWREKLNFKGMNDFDTDVYKYKGRMRFSVGWSDWRGVIGAKPNS